MTCKLHSNTDNLKQTTYNEFIKKFTEINNREPTQDEIISNLKDTLDIDFIKNNFIKNNFINNIILLYLYQIV